MIVALTGTQAAGKGSVVEYLKTKGFKHYSGATPIIEELKKRGMPVNRDTMHEIGNKLRRKNSPIYLTEYIYKQGIEGGGDAVLDSIRGVLGAEFAHKHGVPIIAVDADQRIRYERAQKRGGEKDNVTLEHFVEQEEKELSATEKHAMNVRGVMALADYTIINNGTLEELHPQVDAILEKIKK